MGVAFIGKAKVYVADYAGAAAFEGRSFEYLENVSKISISFAEEEKKLSDYASTSGGVDASVKRVADIAGSIDLRHFTPANLARVFWGTTAVLNTTPIVGESGYKLTAGKFIPTKRLINTSVAPVLKKGATTILTADYTVTQGGILVAGTITTGSVSSGDAITIDYTPVASTDVQALVNSAPNVSLYFDGVNEVDGKKYVGKIWLAKLGVAQNVEFIGDDFGTLSLSVTIQKDETIVTAGKSQYFEMQQVT